MGKYIITYSCSHESTRRYRGSRRDQQWQIARDQEQPCNACRAAEEVELPEPEDVDASSGRTWGFDPQGAGLELPPRHAARLQQPTGIGKDQKQ